MIVMNQWSRHIVVVFLLANYLLLGVVGHLEAITMIGFGTNPHRLVQTKGSSSQTTKVYWTQHKHIPSTVKIAVPSPAVFTPPETPRVYTFGFTFTQGESGISLNPLFSLHSSRAPPQV